MYAFWSPSTEQIQPIQNQQIQQPQNVSNVVIRQTPQLQNATYVFHPQQAQSPQQMQSPQHQIEVRLVYSVGHCIRVL